MLSISRPTFPVAPVTRMVTVPPFPYT